MKKVQCRLEDTVKYYGFDMRIETAANVEECRQICMREYPTCVGKKRWEM